MNSACPFGIVDIECYGEASITHSESCFLQAESTHPEYTDSQHLIASVFISKYDTDIPLLDELLKSFADVFDPPTGLPPQRPCDHRIQLLPDSQPAAVHPYRYFQIQKDELESQCATILQQGIIRPSTSPFSAPVVLVNKQDGSWRFNVNYTALNIHTVKDEFPIPIVQELIDELHAACFFTTLDLRAGYHHIRAPNPKVYHPWIGSELTRVYHLIYRTNPKHEVKIAYKLNT